MNELRYRLVQFKAPNNFYPLGLRTASDGGGTFTAGGGYWLWGSGRDGSLNFDGTNTFSFATKTGSVYVLNRVVHATDCTIAVGVTVQCWDYANTLVGGGTQLYCTGTLTLNGRLSNDGQANLVNPGQSAGLPTVTNPYIFWGSAGGAANGSNNGSPGGALNYGYGGNGGAGGASSTPHTGGAGGVVNTPPTGTPADVAAGINQLWLPQVMQSGRVEAGLSPWIQPFGGGGGGGGGGSTNTGQLGGGGANGGGVFGLFAKIIAGSGIFSCDGAAGNPGAAAGAGGGGGGGGGLPLVLTTTATFASLITVRALGGAAGTATGGGVAGTAGTAGTVASIIIQ